MLIIFLFFISYRFLMLVGGQKGFNSNENKMGPLKREEWFGFWTYIDCDYFRFISLPTVRSSTSRQLIHSWRRVLRHMSSLAYYATNHVPWSCHITSTQIKILKIGEHNGVYVVWLSLYPSSNPSSYHIFMLVYIKINLNCKQILSIEYWCPIKFLGTLKFT